MLIRVSTESDLPQLAALYIDAFGPVQGQEIGKLATDLIADPTARPVLSLVAVERGRVLGHIVFSKVTILPDEREFSASILAPLAVLNAFQRRGIGGQLIREGLAILRGNGVDLAFVLGHPDYYSRHGFRPAGVQGFDAPYPIAEKNAGAWMVESLTGREIEVRKRSVRCAAVLDDPKHWQE